MTPEHLLDIGLRLSLAVVLGFIATWTRDPSDDDLEVTRSATFLSFAGALMLCVVEDQLARAFGLMGAASVVRYRHRLRRADDASDLIIALSLGMACGAGMEVLAATATVVVRGVRALWQVAPRLPGLEPRTTVLVEVRGPDDATRRAAVDALRGRGVALRFVEAEARPSDTLDPRKGLNRWTWEARLPPDVDELGVLDTLTAADVTSVKVQRRPGEGG